VNKPVLGLVLGGVLGIVDGLSALLHGIPEVNAQITSIVIGSTFKGLVAGVLIGWFAKKVQSLQAGLLFGLAVGALLAFAVAAMPSVTGEHYWLEIIIPGSLVGLIVGFATQKYGVQTART
jgi:hypothetical protein